MKEKEKERVIVRRSMDRGRMGNIEESETHLKVENLDEKKTKRKEPRETVAVRK